jgi:hypothetical protein
MLTTKHAALAALAIPLLLARGPAGCQSQVVVPSPPVSVTVTNGPGVLDAMERHSPGLGSVVLVRVQPNE